MSSTCGVTISRIDGELGTMRVTQLARDLYHRAWRKTLRPAGERLARRGRMLRLAQTVEHIFGPRTIAAGPEDVIATTVVRNGEIYVDSFIRHHRELGVRHLVLLDNYSSDSTVERAASYSDVTVLRTRLPYARYENAMKDFLSRRFCGTGWNLCLDIDELWEYPEAERLSLHLFIRYLNEHRYSAVVCQMLDLFSDLPLGRVRSRPGENLKQAYPFYDLTALRSRPYRYGRVVPPGIPFYSHGIRSTVFGTSNQLTKAALVRLAPGIRLYEEWHQTRGVRIADVTCVLRHYPFTEGFIAKVADAAQTGRYGPSATHEYIRYRKALSASDAVLLKGPGARRLRSADQLVDEGFLHVSGAYRGWVTQRGRARGLLGPSAPTRSRRTSLDSPTSPSPDINGRP